MLWGRSVITKHNRRNSEAEKQKVPTQFYLNASFVRMELTARNN